MNILPTKSTVNSQSASIAPPRREKTHSRLRPPNNHTQKPEIPQTSKTTLNITKEPEISPIPKFLCLHGFRTSGEILRKLIERWPESVREKIDLVFLDAPFPSRGKSDVEGTLDPPYYEWYQFNKEFSEYTNFDECIQYNEDFMVENGPFDGLLGFSQGAMLSARLAGMQAQGVTLTKVPRIKCLIIISGGKLLVPAVAERADAPPIRCPSLHFIGQRDFLKSYGLELLEVCVDPAVIHHPYGHTVPRLDENGCETTLKFIDRIQKLLVFRDEDTVIPMGKL